MVGRTAVRRAGIVPTKAMRRAATVERKGKSQLNNPEGWSLYLDVWSFLPVANPT